MNIDEARFKVLEQNVQALQQTAYQILIRLSDLKIVLAGKGLLTHPEERSDIPEHSLQAQVKTFLEKEGIEFPEYHCVCGKGDEAPVEVHTSECIRRVTIKKPRRVCTGDYYAPL